MFYNINNNNLKPIRPIPAINVNRLIFTLHLQGHFVMLPSSKLNITSFSKSARVTRKELKYGKTKLIEVNQSFPIEILIFYSRI